MHNPLNTPTFLDVRSGCTNEQINLMNTIVRTQYNRFQGKIEQSKLKDGNTTKNIKESSYRVKDLKEYNYDGVSVLSFVFDTRDMEVGNSYKIMELQRTSIASYVFNQCGISGDSDKSESYNDISNNLGSLDYFGFFRFEVNPSSGDYYISFIATNSNNTETNILPNATWNCTIQCYIN